MKIIDAHAHIFPEKIAAAAVKATGEFYAGAQNEELLAPPDLTHCLGTAEDLLRENAEAGISRSVVFSTATTPRQVESINSFIARECAAHREFIGVGTMHIDYPDFESEVRRIRELGLVGIKLHPDIQRFALDDDRLLPLYDCMRAEHLFLVAHTGDYRYDYSGPRRMARLAKLFPEMSFIGAHYGGWSEWTEARECLVLPNVYVDTSSTQGFTGGVSARKGLETFDPTHIFFGTDYPMWKPAEEVERFLSLGVDEKRLEGILHENFENFLKELSGVAV